MRRIRLRLPSPSMIVAGTALFVSLGGVSYGVATGYIDGREIKNNAVGTKDLKNNDIRGKDVRRNSLTGSDIIEARLGKVPSAASADTAANAANAATAANAAQLGGKGPSAYLQYGGTLPSGTTVVGNWYAAPSTDTAGSLGFDEVDFPAPSSAAVTDATSNMGAGTTNGQDNDATCTGNADAPTAPAGKLCFYVGFQTGLTELEAFLSNGPKAKGGAVRVVGGAGGSRYARGGWAYTAP
jgi:hypothetical protein